MTMTAPAVIWIEANQNSSLNIQHATKILVIHVLNIQHATKILVIYVLNIQHATKIMVIYVFIVYDWHFNSFITGLYSIN